MSNIQLESKRGGPYTKKDQTARRNQVYKLYFEYGFPAVKIAEKLNVNRNTINEDIKYWYSQIAIESENLHPSYLLMKHIKFLESQKWRLHEELEEINELDKKLPVEKLIFEIENKITHILLKITQNRMSLISFKKQNDCSQTNSHIE